MADTASLPVQLRQQKNQWNTKDVPKGKIQDIIKNFSQVRKLEQLELVNTGKKNQHIVHDEDKHKKPDIEKLTRAEYEAKKARMQAKREAAIKIQCAVRQIKAQKILQRKREAAETRRRAQEEAKRRAEQEALRKAQEEEERQRREIEAKERAEREAKERAERQAREKIEREQEAQRRAILKKEQTAAAIKIQALVRSGLTRVRVRIMVEKLIEEMLREQAEEERKKQEEERKLREEEEAKLREERRKAYFKEHGLFTGPIEPEVGLLTSWWMENVPHKTYHQDDFDDAMDKLWEKSLEERFFVFGLLNQAQEESLLENSGGGRSNNNNYNHNGYHHGNNNDDEEEEEETLLNDAMQPRASTYTEYEEVSVIDEMYDTDGDAMSLLDEEDEDHYVFEDE